MQADAIGIQSVKNAADGPGAAVERRIHFQRHQAEQENRLVGAAVVALIAIVGFGALPVPPRPELDRRPAICHRQSRSAHATGCRSNGAGRHQFFSQVSGLRVLSFNLVQQYKGKEVDPRAVGRELDVPSILYGRITKVQGDESSIIVNLELVNTRDGSQRWSMERTVKTLDHALLVDEIVTSVSNNIGLSLTGDERKKRDAEALYVKGRNSVEQTKDR